VEQRDVAVHVTADHPALDGAPVGRHAVYNAGSRTIVLDQDQRVFMIWFADLDFPDDNPYPDRAQGQFVITADDVSKIQGDVASPAVLKRQLDELKVDLDKKFHATEQTRLGNRSVIMLLLGAALALGGSLIKSCVDSNKPYPSETRSWRL